jgi:hypothetical protein
LNLNSEDLITPGPTIYYEFEGKEHTWITDAIYVPYNLVFDIKDGGDNKNNREMPEYRAKQIAKEKVITDQGEYNYIRLTNNEFVQLLTIFAELKESYLNDTEPKTISRIHEHMGPAGPGGMPAVPADTAAHSVFITNYMNKNTFDSGFALSNDVTSEYMLARDKETGRLKKVKTKDLLEDCEFETFKYLGDDVAVILKEAFSKYKSNEYVDYQYLPCLMTEFSEILSDDQLMFSNMLEIVDWEQINENFNSNIATLEFQANAFLEGERPYIFCVLDPVKYEYKKKILREYEDLSILQDIDGMYFAYNKLSCKRTRGVESIYEISEQMLKSIANQY